MLREGKTRLLGSGYSPFLIKTAFMNGDVLGEFSGSCFCFCDSNIVSTMESSLFTAEPYYSIEY